jgi:hypothetical protein
MLPARQSWRQVVPCVYLVSYHRRLAGAFSPLPPGVVVLVTQRRQIIRNGLLGYFV